MGILNDKDLKIIKNYVAIGYTLNPIEPVKKEVKIATEEEKAKNPYSALNIQRFLSEKAGKNEDGKPYIDIYWELYKKPLKSGACYKDDSADGMFKAGQPRVKGHVGTLKWFKDTFEGYVDSEWVKENIKEKNK